MAKDYDNVRVYGDEDDAVFLAPLGSTLPTGLAAPDAAFEDVGTLGEGDFKQSREAEVNELLDHSGQIVAVVVPTSGKTVEFEAIEDNEVVEALANDIISGPTTATGVTTTTYSGKYTPKTRAMVVDKYFVKDGVRYLDRLVVPSARVVVSGDEVWSRENYTAYAATAKIIGQSTRIVGPAV
ncbi:hypothetical protein [Isoptericola sp. NPDC056134]|uniref:hypothetical protein n=1 Tax=Isoptericola sp. NPDC056134 TaxID=3345723 RepID=UPI0035EF559D